MTQDHIAIQNVLSEYSLAASRRDVDAIVATFVIDGIWEVPAIGGDIEGREAIHAAMSGFLAGTEHWFQLNTPAIIAIDGDTATARSTIYEGGKLSASGEMMNVAGFYDDELVRTSEGWKFQRRIFRGISSTRYTPNRTG